MAYDSWKSHDVAAERGGDGEELLKLVPPMYRLHVYYERGLDVSCARLLKLECPRKGWELVSEQIVAGNDEAGALRALRESRAHVSAECRVRRVRELKARGELERRVPTWL